MNIFQKRLHLLDPQLAPNILRKDPLSQMERKITECVLDLMERGAQVSIGPKGSIEFSAPTKEKIVFQDKFEDVLKLMEGYACFLEQEIGREGSDPSEMMTKLLLFILKLDADTEPLLDWKDRARLETLTQKLKTLLNMVTVSAKHSEKLTKVIQRSTNSRGGGSITSQTQKNDSGFTPEDKVKIKRYLDLVQKGNEVVFSSQGSVQTVECRTPSPTTVTQILDENPLTLPTMLVLLNENILSLYYEIVSLSKLETFAEQKAQLKEIRDKGSLISLLTTLINVNLPKECIDFENIKRLKDQLDKLTEVIDNLFVLASKPEECPTGCAKVSRSGEKMALNMNAIFQGKAFLPKELKNLFTFIGRSQDELFSKVLVPPAEIRDRSEPSIFPLTRMNEFEKDLKKQVEEVQGLTFEMTALEKEMIFKREIRKIQSLIAWTLGITSEVQTDNPCPLFLDLKNQVEKSLEVYKVILRGDFKGFSYRKRTEALNIAMNYLADLEKVAKGEFKSGQAFRKTGKAFNLPADYLEHIAMIGPDVFFSQELKKIEEFLRASGVLIVPENLSVEHYQDKMNLFKARDTELRQKYANAEAVYEERVQVCNLVLNKLEKLQKLIVNEVSYMPMNRNSEGRIIRDPNDSVKGRIIYRVNETTGYLANGKRVTLSSKKSPKVSETKDNSLLYAGFFRRDQD